MGHNIDAVRSGGGNNIFRCKKEREKKGESDGFVERLKLRHIFFPFFFFEDLQCLEVTSSSSQISLLKDGKRHARLRTILPTILPQILFAE